MSDIKQTETYRGFVCPKLSRTFEEGINSLQLTNLPRQKLKPNEVRLALRATALDYYDLLMLIGRYQYRPPVPFVPCNEASGVVIEIGSKVKQWNIGDHVLLGMTGFGALASEMVALSSSLVAKPISFSFAEAAGFPVGFITAYNGLVHRGGLKAGEWLMVTGAAGGMGAAAIQLGKALGAKVIACASSNEKLKICSSLGADFVINYGTGKTDKTAEDMKQRVQQITNGAFVDVIYEIVGGDVFDECVRCVSHHGRLLVVGFASGRIPTLPVNLALVKCFSLIGVASGASIQKKPELITEIMTKLVEYGNKGLLRPHIHQTFDGTQEETVKHGLMVMAQRQVHGKIIIDWAPKSKL